jgi:hypothetical protein
MRYEYGSGAARETLREGINRLRTWVVIATGHYSARNAIDEIYRLAEALKIDLIKIGHHSHGFFARWWTSENHALLLDRASCGVLFEVDG